MLKLAAQRTVSLTLRITENTSASSTPHYSDLPLSLSFPLSSLASRSTIRLLSIFLLIPPLNVHTRTRTHTHTHVRAHTNTHYSHPHCAGSGSDSFFSSYFHHPSALPALGLL